MRGLGTGLRRAKALWALPTVKVALLFHVALALALSFFPLFDVLGFERAFVTGLFTAPLGALLGLALLAEARRRPAPPPFPRVALEAASVSVLSLAPTALAGLGVELFRRPCDPGEGALLLLLTAGVSGVYGAAVGSATGVLLRRRAGATLLAFVVLGLGLVGSLHRLYAEPQIFVYDLAFGYWPGSIYDEEVGLAGALLHHRLYTLLVAGAVVAATRALVEPGELRVSLRALRAGRAVLAACLVAGSIFVQRSGEALGFDLRRSTVDRALSRVVETKHYTLRTDPSVPRDQLHRITRDLAYRHAELSQFFGRAPSRLTVYLYRDVGQKRALMGAARTQIAKPWSREIHIHGFEVPHGVLKHELAHVFAAEFSSSRFGVPTAAGFFPNIGLIEGLAVAADWRVQRGLSVHESTKAMKDLGLLPDLSRMFYPQGFWAISSSRAYTAAGSFLRFLYDRYGGERLFRLYDANDVEGVYGKPLGVLEEEWSSFLDEIALPAKFLPKEEQRFKQPAIFEKACAHEVAQLFQEAHAAMGVGDLAEAEHKIERAFLHQPWRTDGLIALAQAHLVQGELETARALLERARDAATTAGAKSQAESALADLAWEKGDTEPARAGFEAVLASHPGEEQERLFLVKRALLERPAEVQAVVRPYLLGRTNPQVALVELMELAAAHPGDGLIQYLLGRRLEAVGAHRQGARALDLVLELGLPEGPSLGREALLTSGRLLLETGDLARAEARFREAADRAETEGDRLFAEDWADRAAFYARPAPE